MNKFISFFVVLHFLFISVSLYADENKINLNVSQEIAVVNKKIFGSIV